MKVIVTYEHEATARAPEGSFTWRDGQRIRAVGQVIETPDCWKLVANGLADPADEECWARFTPDQVAYAKEVGHPALIRLHAEARQEALDNVEMVAFIEPNDEEEN